MKLAYVVYKKPAEAYLRMQWAPNRRIANMQYEQLRERLGVHAVRPPVDYAVTTKPGVFPDKDKLVDWLNDHCGWMRL